MSKSNINKNLPLDKAELIAFFLEGVLFGVSALLYLITVWVLFYQRKSEHLNKRLLITSSLLALFSTLHIAVDLSRILEGFINRRNLPGGPNAYFGRLFEWSFIFKTLIFVIQAVIADSFATYRCFVVWNRWWAIVAPSIFVTATAVTGLAVVYNCAHLEAGRDVFASSLTGWITAFFTFTLATNLTCTSLISSRIWFTTRKVARFSGQQTLLPVVIIVVESGAIYSLSCISILVVYLLDSNAQYPAIDGVFPIISIVFNLIIVRIALGISHGPMSGAQTTQNPPSGIVDPTRSQGTGVGAHGSLARQNAQGQYPMKPLAVTVTQLVQQESDIEGEGDKAHGRGRGVDVEADGDSESFTLGKERGSWNAV